MFPKRNKMNFIVNGAILAPALNTNKLLKTRSKRLAP